MNLSWDKICFKIRRNIH